MTHSHLHLHHKPREPRAIVPAPAVRARLAATLDRGIEDAGGRWRTGAEILDLLAAAGVTGWIAGGAVRDAVCGERPNDVDIVVSAHISGVRALVAAVCGEASIQLCNEAIGSLRLGMTDAHFDIGMFRDIDSIEGHRSMATVRWGLGDMAADAGTTDFTVNALYWRPEGPVMDPTGRGYSDAVERRLELSSDPRKTAIDHRLSLRLALFAARGYRPTREAAAFFRGRIDRDVDRFGDLLPVFMEELSGGSAALREAIVACCDRLGASPRTVDSLRSAGPAAEPRSFWGSMDSFA